MLWYKKMLKGELVMLEEVIYKEEILTGHLYTNRDALRNSNYQTPDQSPVEPFAVLMCKRKLRVLYVTNVCFVRVSILMINVNNTSF